MSLIFTHFTVNYVIDDCHYLNTTHTYCDYNSVLLFEPFENS